MDKSALSEVMASLVRILGQSRPHTGTTWHGSFGYNDRSFWSMSYALAVGARVRGVRHAKLNSSDKFVIQLYIPPTPTSQ